MKSLFTLYIGGQFDRFGNPIKEGLAYTVIREGLNSAAKTFGGSTMLIGWGEYEDQNGGLTLEKSARIEVVTDSHRGVEVRALAESIRIGLNAESVLVTETRLQDVYFAAGRSKIEAVA
jgi:hypothetical protein